VISCFKFSADKNSRALTGASFIKSKSLKSGFKTIYTPIKPIKLYYNKKLNEKIYNFH